MSHERDLRASRESGVQADLFQVREPDHHDAHSPPVGVPLPLETDPERIAAAAAIFYRCPAKRGCRLRMSDCTEHREEHPRPADDANDL